MPCREDFVTTTKPFKKVTWSLKNLRKDGVYVIVAIDYFTRFIVAKVKPDKKSVIVERIVRGSCSNGYLSESMITDNDRGFQNDEFKKFIRTLRIEHCLVGVKDHRSNGRVERVVRTIKEVLVNIQGMQLERKMELITNTYNSIHHIGIKCTPIRNLYVN